MALKKSKVFTTGPYYGSKFTTALKYCYPAVNSKGALVWRTRTWAYWRSVHAANITTEIRRLRRSGMIYFPQVKQGQAVSEAQQKVLKKSGLLDHVQLQLRKV